MSSFPFSSRDSSIPEFERPQRASSIQPQLLQQRPSRLPNDLASPNCTNDGSAVAIKPLCHSEPGIGDAYIDAEAQCAALRPSRLLSIPVELRQRILSFILPYSRPDDKYGSIWHLGDTNVLRTCRKLHEEGTSILYSSNTFTINVRRGGYAHAVRSVFDRSDLALRKGLLMWFYHYRSDESVTIRDVYEPLPMRPEDIWLIRRWKIHIAEMDDFRGYGSHDDLRLALLLQNRVRDLVDRILKGRPELKVLRVKWQGGYQTAAEFERYRKTILKPIREKAMTLEEGFYV